MCRLFVLLALAEHEYCWVSYGTRWLKVDSGLDRFGLGMGKVLPTLETITR